MNKIYLKKTLTTFLLLLISYPSLSNIANTTSYAPLDDVLVEYTAIDEEVREVNDLDDYDISSATSSVTDLIDFQDGELFSASQSIQTHVNNITDLNSKIKEITFDLNKEQNSNSELAIQIKKLNKNAQDFEVKLQDVLTAKQKEKEEQLQHIKELTESNNSFKSETTAKIQAHIKSITKLNSELAKINLELKQQVKANSLISEQLTTLSDKSKTIELSLQKTLSQKETDLFDLKSALGTLKASASIQEKTSSKMINIHVASITSLSAEIKTLKDELVSQSTINKDLNHDIAKLTSKITLSEDALKKTLASKELQANTHVVAIKKLTSSKDGELSDASKKIQHHLNNIHKLNAQLSSLNKQLNLEIQSNVILSEKLTALTEKTKSVEESLKQTLINKEIDAASHVLAIKELISTKDGELSIASKKIQAHIENIAELSSQNNYLKKLSTTEFFKAELDKNRLKMIERKKEVSNISKFFSTELTNSKAEISSKTIEISKLTNKINYLLEVQTSKTSQSNTKYNKILSEKNNLIASLNSSQANSKTLTIELKELTSFQKAEAKAHIAELLTKTNALNSLNSKINTLLSITSSSKLNFDDEIKELLAQKTILNKDLSNASVKIKNLSEKISSMNETTKADNQKHIDELLLKSTKINALNGKITSLLQLTSTTQKKLDYNISNLTTTKGKLEDNLTKLNKQHEELTTKYNNSIQQNTTYSEKISKLTDTVEKLKNIANNKGSTINNLSLQLKTLTTNKEILQKQLTQLKGQPVPETNEYISKIEVLTTQTTNKIQKLKNELVVANNSISTLEEKLAATQTKKPSSPATSMKSLFSKLNKSSMPEGMKNSLNRYLSSRSTTSAADQSVERYKKRINALTISLNKSQNLAIKDASKLRREIQMSKDKISELTRSINNSFNSNIQISSALKKDIASYKLQISDLNARLKFSTNSDLSVPALKNDIATYKRQISDLSKRIETFNPTDNATFNHLQKDNANYKKQISDLTKRLSKFTLYPTTNDIVITPANKLIVERDNLIKLLITEQKLTNSLTDINHGLSNEVYKHNNSLSDIISNLNQKDQQISILLAENKRSLMAFDVMQNNLVTINNEINTGLDAAKLEISQTEITLRSKINKMIYTNHFISAKNLINNTQSQTKYSFTELKDFTTFFTSIDGYKLGLVTTANISTIQDKDLQQFLIKNAIMELSEKSLLLDFVSIIRSSTILKDDKHRQLIDLFTKINEYTQAIKESIEINEKTSEDLIMLVSITERLTSIETMFYQIINQ